MINKTMIAEKYSQAFFDLAKDQQLLEPLEEDLLYVREVLADHPELRSFLGNPVIEAGEKRGLIGKIFKDAIQKLTLQFLYVMINRRRESCIIEAIDGYVAKSREARNIQMVKVLAAAPLTEAEEEKLKNRLESLTGKTIMLEIRLDPSLLGGMVIQIGDTYIDASVGRRLEELKKSLIQANMTEIGVDDAV